MTPARRPAAHFALLLAALLLAGCTAATEPPPPGAESAPPPVKQLDPHRPDPGPAPTATAVSTDAADVVFQYVVTSRTVSPDGPSRAAEAYMTPTNPERGLGQQWAESGVAEEPRDITVTEAGRTEDRAVYEVAFVLVSENGSRPVEASIVCERQPGGTWLVARDSPHLDTAH